MHIHKTTGPYQYDLQGFEDDRDPIIYKIHSFRIWKKI